MGERKPATIKSVMRSYRLRIRHDERVRDGRLYPAGEYHPNWIVEVAQRMAKHLTKELKKEVSFSGPAGLMCRFWLEAQDDSLELCFLGPEAGIGRTDWTKKTRNYAEGSIGEMNGMNFETTPLSEDVPLVDLWNLYKHPTPAR